MEDRLITLIILVLISVTAAGCSVVRVMQTNAGVDVEKIASKTEGRQTELNKRDFRLGFGATDDYLGIRLEYLPYYNLETRDIVRYKPQKGSRSFELVLGIVEAGLFGWALFDNLVETGEVAVNDDGELYNVSEFDWDRVTPLQYGIMAATTLDFIFWVYYSTEYEATVHEPWKNKGEVSGEWEYLRNHPYRIELPSYNFGKDYRSNTGNENIDVREFLTGIKNPVSLMDINAVSFSASTEFGGKEYLQTLRFTTPSQLQPFREAALAAKGIDMVTTGKPRLMPRPETTFRWNDDAMEAGKTATIWVTVKNTGKGILYRLTARTVSTDKTFNNRELKFGKIDPGNSISVPVSFDINKLMRTQEIPISIKFAEYNDHVPEDIISKLKVMEISRPKFDYAYRIIDGGTDTSVGNGDGIFQRGESADVQVAIRNSGKGNATGVTTRLNLIDRTGVDIYGDTLVNLQTLESGDAKVATFNVGVKRNTSVNTLHLRLSVQENTFGTETGLSETINLPIGRVTAPRVKDLNLVATITSNSAQIYNGASNVTSISAEIPQNSQVKVSGQLGEWYRVEFDKQNQKIKGWVHQTQLTTAKITTQENTQIKTPEVVEIYQNTPPTLALFEPGQKRAMVDTRTMKLQGIAVANKGINKVELTINGKTSDITRQGMRTTRQKPPTVFKIDQNIILNYGLNTIKLSAFDTNNQTSEPIVLTITREREEVRNDYALLFGVNSYEHFDPWHKLNNPIPDTEAIGNELKNRYGFAVEVVSDPSRDEILTKINEYARKRYNDSDQLLIFFAGHGYYEERNNIGIGYLVASDTFPPEADRGKSSYISHGDLSERIENIGCDHIFLIVDACFSGAFDAPIAQFNRARGGNRISDDVSRSEFIKQTLAYKTRWYLTSGGKEYVSDGRPNQHSPFTRRVLDALRSTGGGKHGILTLEDIGRYVEKATPQPRAGEFGTNAPGSNFLFIRK